jgi:NAD/NADP transhydrogenase alpha subunit
MRVGVARETAAGERRVALVPEAVAKLVAAGFDVVVEPGAGAEASFLDDAYTEPVRRWVRRGRRTCS